MFQLYAIDIQYISELINQIIQILPGIFVQIALEPTPIGNAYSVQSPPAMRPRGGQSRQSGTMRSLWNRSYLGL